MTDLILISKSIYRKTVLNYHSTLVYKRYTVIDCAGYMQTSYYSKLEPLIPSNLRVLEAVSHRNLAEFAEAVGFN